MTISRKDTSQLLAVILTVCTSIFILNCIEKEQIMSQSGNEFIAKTQGAQFTLYAMCRAMGIPLTKEQEDFQAYLERTYPATVEKKDGDEDS